MTASIDLAAQLYYGRARSSSGELCPHDGTRLGCLAAARDPLLGRALDGRYTILEKLGQAAWLGLSRAAALDRP